MFFLLYVPTIRERMSRKQMQDMAAQLADQVLAQTVQSEEERTPEAREAVRAQLFDMMLKVQAEFQPENVPEAAESEAETQEEALPSETPELADMREYLERCLKFSA